MTAISSQTSGHELKLKPTVSASVATVGDFFPANEATGNEPCDLHWISRHVSRPG
ncbi:MAG: hypothetical protein CM15mP119_4160 [Alphaproteobacteria bacterium]|nr:MAG: hypothetical protein CM15mP119_4160 [Alphaproteobacteria bacterium]